MINVFDIDDDIILKPLHFYYNYYKMINVYDIDNDIILKPQHFYYNSANDKC